MSQSVLYCAASWLQGWTSRRGNPEFYLPPEVRDFFPTPIRPLFLFWTGFCFISGPHFFPLSSSVFGPCPTVAGCWLVPTSLDCTGAASKKVCDMLERLQRMTKSSHFAKAVFFSVHYSLPKMFIVVLLMENTLHAAAALFSVDVPQSSYTVKLGGEVVMECRFPVKHALKMEELMITWLHTAPSQKEQKEVYVLHKGEEDLSNQDTHFIGRAALLKEGLYTGEAQLQITNVSFSDRGTYMCLIAYGGADYKHIDLIVKAPYATIHGHTELAAGGDELVLTCTAEGYPLAEVYWQEDSANVSVQVNTSSASTADGLYNVTSTLRARLQPGKKYHCLFWNQELQETTSRELFPQASHNAAVVESSHSSSYILSLAGVALIILCAVPILIRKYRQKFRSRNDRVNAGIVAISHFEEAGCYPYTDVPCQNTMLSERTV